MIIQYLIGKDISDKTTKRDIKKLVDQDLIIKIGVKKGAYFEVK